MLVPLVFLSRPPFQPGQAACGAPSQKMAPPLPSPIRSAHTFFPLVGYPNIRFTLHQPAPRLSANSPDRLLRHDFGREFTGDSESAIRFKPAAGLSVEKDEFSASGPGFTLVQFKQRRGILLIITLSGNQAIRRNLDAPENPGPAPPAEADGNCACPR